MAGGRSLSEGRGLTARWAHPVSLALQISISDYVVFDQGSLFQTLLQATQSVASASRGPVERVVAFLSQHSQCQPSLVSSNCTGVWVASGRNQLHLARGSLIGQQHRGSAVQCRSRCSAVQCSAMSSVLSAVPCDSDSRCCFLCISQGTFWQNVVPRGTVSATRWSFITASAVPHREGSTPAHLSHTHSHTHLCANLWPRPPHLCVTCSGSFLWLAQSRKDLFCVWDQDGELRPSSVPLPPEVTSPV